MKIAYLILAHECPAHLGRLVDALASPPSGVFVHVDRKSDLARFHHLEAAGVRFTRRRVLVQWGDYSQVAAILELLREGLADPNGYERFVLISGADYPLRSAAALERFFDTNRDREYINLTPMPDDAGGKPIARLTTYQLSPGTGAVSRSLRRLLQGVGRRVHTRDYRARLGGRAPYGGSTWWALSRAACDRIVAVVDDEPQVAAFFRHAICPDESFFHTIIGNSEFGSRADPNLTFVDWTAGGQNPSRIRREHLQWLLAASPVDDERIDDREFLFARKFTDDDTELVDELDRMIAGQDAVA